jgi:hypothetical protein
MEDYLTLLRETLDLLINIHKSCGPSVADDILQLETAAQFIYKALKTEDRLDIFRALQKSYDALKIEYEVSAGDEEYDDLVEKLKKALEGLQQQQEGILKKSTLKKLTKMVLDEIFLPPRGPEAALQTFHQAIEMNKPDYLKTIKEGYKQAHKVLRNMVKSLKVMMSTTIKKDKKEFQKAKKTLTYNSEWLVSFVIQWAYQINDEDDKVVNAIDKIIQEMRTHFIAMSDWGNAMIDSIGTYQNYINASKELEHINESFEGMRKAVDDLFQIGLDIGYDKKQMDIVASPPVAGKKGEIIWPNVPFTFDTLIAQNPHIDKATLRKELQIALTNKSVFIQGMMIGGGDKPVLLFMKRQ